MTTATKSKIAAARDAYFTKVHAIQRSRGCTFQEAVKIYNDQKNGQYVAAGPDAAGMSLDTLQALATTKVAQICEEVAALQDRLNALNTEIIRWRWLAEGLSNSDPNQDTVQLQEHGRYELGTR